MTENTVNKQTLTKKKYGKLTRLERGKVENLENEADTAEIKETGQDNKKKGDQAVKQVEGIKQEVENKVVIDWVNKLDMKRKYRRSYKSILAKAFAEKLQDLDWIDGWEAEVVITTVGSIKIKGKPFATKDGILLVVGAKDGRIFHQGILVTQDPFIDYEAVKTLSICLENQMDKEKGSLEGGGVQRFNMPEKYRIKGLLN